jgi:sporulation protein YlmC with PRC-barrel domain
MKHINGAAVCWLALTLLIGESAQAQQSPGLASQGGTADAGLKAHEFVATLRPHQWRVSKLIGLDVYGSEHEKIGDISDIFVAAEGDQVVVIGVGGFLGLGDRQVAVPFRAVEWRYGDPPTKSNTQVGANATTGAATGPRKTVDSSQRGYPDYAVLRVSKEVLRDAREFRLQ